MRILVVSNVYPPYYLGGYELGCAEVVDALRRKSHSVRVLTSSFGLRKPRVDGEIYRLLKIKFSEPTGLGMLRHVRTEYANQRIFRKQVADFSPQVIYLWNMQLGLVPLTFAADQSRVPVAYYVSDHWVRDFGKHDFTSALFAYRRNGIFHRWTRLILKLLLRSSGYQLPIGLPQPSLVQFCSDFLKSSSTDILRSPRNVVHWGIDETVFNGKPRDWPPKKCLYVGQLLDAKGVHTAIRAFSEVASDPACGEVSLTIVGAAFSAEYERLLHKIASESPAKRQISFRGKLSRQQLPQLYRDHDILIFPSEWDEPFSIGLLEALASGLAVVATQTGGTPEVLVNGETGVTFSTGCFRSCAVALKSLITNRSLYERVANKGRDVVSTRFTMNTMVDTIEGQLMQLLKQAE